MNLRENLLNNSSLVFDHNIFYQKELARSQRFEDQYIQLREKENRVYTDEAVMKLPEISNSHSQKKEWAIRKKSSAALISYLASKPLHTILEVGCGNGWLTHLLANSLHTESCGIDVNETELLQGARLFATHQNVSFIYGDIFTVRLQQHTFDTIILASSLQYFSEPKQLIKRLFEIVTLLGEIHIIDTPFYDSPEKAQAAHSRSQDYFASIGFDGMTANYFHHTFHDLKDFKHQIMFNPKSVSSIISRKLLNTNQSVFPWIKIIRN